MKLSDTQLVILSAASQREDRCIILPETLMGSAASKFVQKLTAASLLEEVPAQGKMPVWRREDDGKAFALRITEPGLSAINAAEPPDKAKAGKADKSAGRKKTAAKATTPANRSHGDKPKKMDGVLKLLDRPLGATLDEIMKLTGWLPHSARAALSGLRKRGMNLQREADKKDVSRYRIGPAQKAARPAKAAKARA